MKIYMSASFVDQKRLRPFRDALWAMGHVITSSWLDETEQPAGLPRDAFMRKLGIKDVGEIMEADLLINDLENPSTSGGRDVEYGIGVARHQKCQLWTVGAPPRSPFHFLADRNFETWEEVLVAAKELTEEAQR